MKKQVLEVVDLQFKLKLKLLDQILEKIGDLRKDGKQYNEIADIIGIDSSALSKFIKPDIVFVEGLKNSTLAKWNLKLTK